MHEIMKIIQMKKLRHKKNVLKQWPSSLYGLHISFFFSGREMNRTYSHSSEKSEQQ